MNTPNIFSVIRRTFGAYRRHLALLVVLGLVGALLEGIGINAVIPLFSFLTGDGHPADFITQGLENLFALVHIPFQFRYLLAFVLFLFLLRAVAVVLFGYLRGWIVADFLHKESNDTLGRTLRASWPFLLGQKLGTVHSGLVRDIERAGNLLEALGRAIQFFTGFLIYLVVAVNISPLLTLVTALGGTILLGVTRPFLLRVRRKAGELGAVERGVAQFVSEHIIGMKSVKVLAQEEPAIRKGRSLFDRLRVLRIQITLLKSLSASLFQPFSLVFVMILFSVMYKSPDFNLISFAAALYLIQKIFAYLESGQSALTTVNESAPYAEDLERFKRTLAEHRENKSTNERSFAFEREIVFDNVSLSYQERGAVLHDISFSIARGETVALIGPSGAGKTSLADILLRLFEPTEGRLTLDGMPAQEIDLVQWRSCIGYVSQDVFMFNGTIKENISFYRSELSMDEITAAARQANIYDFIMSLPEGFDTHVGDRGVMLSGGQRQRVALARALAGKPNLLVLDEATSALDAESERLIQGAIRGLHGSVTVFIIAHRLTTVENADTILVLENGRIAERGTPQELMQNPDSYLLRHMDPQSR